MAECDGFFDEAGIPFEPEYQDAAVYAVWSADFYDPPYKKWLILCWFDTTYGQWNGNRYDLKNSRVTMADFLSKSKYGTYEELIASKYPPSGGKREN